jgi:hypothetical protein
VGRQAQVRGGGLYPTWGRKALKSKLYIPIFRNLTVNDVLTEILRKASLDLSVTV